jgi:hypothetical protein
LISTSRWAEAVLACFSVAELTLVAKSSRAVFVVPDAPPETLTLATPQLPLASASTFQLVVLSFDSVAVFSLWIADSKSSAVSSV